MRIMVVDPGFEYSTLAVAESYYSAFERLGYEVVEYDLLSAMKIVKEGIPKESQTYGSITEMACAPILNQIIQDRINLVIMVHGYFLNPSIVLSIRSLGCKTALILTDDPMQVDVSKQWSQHYDFVFTNDKNTVKEHKNCRYLPVAVNDQIFHPQEVEEKYKSDILIAGSFYQERIEFIKQPKIKDLLLRHNTRLVGARKIDTEIPELDALFADNKIPYEEMAKYTAGAKICIDIPRDEFKPNLFGFANQRKIAASCLSPRIFECAASGTLCFTSYDRSDIFSLFDQHFENMVYNDVDCLCSMVYRYLNNDTEEIEFNIMQYCLDNHTYMHRAKEIEDVVMINPTKSFYCGNVYNVSVNKSLEEEWRKNFNILKEKGFYTEERSIECFKDSHKNSVCSVVSNGPTLQRSILDLNYGEIIITVNDALNIVDRSDFQVMIHPTIDVYERCINERMYFEAKNKKFPFLLASTLLHHKVIEEWDKYADKGVYFFNTTVGSEVKKEVVDYTGYPLISSGFTVGYSAVNLALYMGFNKIRLFGLDYCYYDNRKYVYEDELTFEGARKKEFIMAPNRDGKVVLTDHVMVKSRDLLLGLIKENPDTLFVNNGKGLLFDSGLKNLIQENDDDE